MTKKKRKSQSFRDRFKLQEKQDESGRVEFEKSLELALEKDVSPSEEELCYLDIDYEISTDSISDPLIESLSEKDLNKFKKGYHFLLEKPKRAISIFKELTHDYPHIPTFHNHLMVALQSIKSENDIKKMVEEHYLKNQNYLFAKTNYAIQLIREDRANEAFDVLEHKFNLSELYPERNLFHVTEHINFAAAVAHYFSAIGRISFAELFCELIEEWDDEHPLLDSIFSISSKNPILQLALFDSLAGEVEEELGEDADLEWNEVIEPEKFEEKHNPLLLR